MDATVAPHFLSRGQTYRSVVGDTLVLPCEVEDLGKLSYTADLSNYIYFVFQCN